MYVLNYIYFIIITLLGLSYLYRKQKRVTSPFDRHQKLLFDGPELFWTLTFSTGLLAFSAPAGLDLMAIRLMVLEIFCLLGLFLVKRRAITSPAIALYVLYIVWLLIGMFYTPSPFYGFRVILKYLYPFLIMLFASAAVRNEEVFLKAGLGARALAVASIIISFIPHLEWTLFPGVIWSGTARAINYISMCIFSLALFFYMGKNKKDLWLAILFAVPCIVWVFRTSIMGTTLALMMFFFFRYRLKSLPVIACVLLLFVSAVFFIPSVNEKMFNKEGTNISQLESGKLSKDDINSNARFEMWEWSLKKFYEKKEMQGSGTGNLQQVFYTSTPFTKNGRGIVHNDYVQILCDNGLIGLVLFLLPAFFAIIHSFKVFVKKNVSLGIKVCAITTGASMMGVLLTMLTDNVINYSMATLSYPFGFYGMMLGLSKGHKINAV
jgi:hypothetical protein